MKALVLLVISVVFSESSAKNIPVAWNSRVHHGGLECRKPGGQCLDEHTLQICTGNLKPIVTIDCSFRRQGPYCNSEHNKCWRSVAEDKGEDRGRCPGQGLYPDPSDCRKYYRCSEARGTYETHTCSENEYFRFKLQKCKIIKDRDDCNIIDCRRRWGRFVKLHDSDRLYAFCNPNSVNNALFECPIETEFNISLQKCIINSSEESESSEELENDIQSQSTNIISSKNENVKQNIPSNTILEQHSASVNIQYSVNIPIDSVFRKSPNNETWDLRQKIIAKSEHEESDIPYVVGASNTTEKGKINSFEDPSISKEHSDGVSNSITQLKSNENRNKEEETVIDTKVIIPQLNRDNSVEKESLLVKDTAENTSNIKLPAEKVIGDTEKQEDASNSMYKNNEQQLLDIIVFAGPVIVADIKQELNGEVGKILNDSQQDSLVNHRKLVTKILTINNQAVTNYSGSINNNNAESVSIAENGQEVNGERNNILDENQKTSIVSTREQVIKTSESKNDIDDIIPIDNITDKTESVITTENEKEVNTNQEIPIVKGPEQATIHLEIASNIAEISPAKNSERKILRETVVENTQKTNGKNNIISNDERYTSVSDSLGQAIIIKETANGVIKETPDNESIAKSEIISENTYKITSEINNISNDNQKMSTSHDIDSVITHSELVTNSDIETPLYKNVNNSELEIAENAQKANSEVNNISNINQHTSAPNNVEQAVAISKDTRAKTPDNNSIDTKKSEMDHEKMQETNGKVANILNDAQQISNPNDVKQELTDSNVDSIRIIETPGEKRINKEESKIITENALNTKGEDNNISNKNQKSSAANNIEQVLTVPEINNNTGTESFTDNSLIKADSEVNDEVYKTSNENQRTSVPEGVQVIKTSETISDVSKQIEDDNSSNNNSQTSSPADDAHSVIATTEIVSDVGTEIPVDISVTNEESETIIENEQDKNGNVVIISNVNNHNTSPVAVEQVATILKTDNNVRGETLDDDGINKAETEKPTENTEDVKVQANNISTDNSETSPVDGVEQQVKNLEDTQWIQGETNDDIGIETSTYTNINKVPLETFTENSAKQEVTSIMNNDQQISTRNDMRQTVKVLDRTDEVIYTTIDEENVTMAPDANTQKTEKQIINRGKVGELFQPATKIEQMPESTVQFENSEILITTNSVQDSVSTDRNILTEPTNSVNKVTEINVNPENNPSPNNDNQLANYVVSGELITDNNTQMLENKLLLEYAPIDANIHINGPDNSSKNYLVFDFSEVTDENIDPAKLQPEIANGDNAINTISPIAAHTNQQSDSNIVTSEFDKDNKNEQTSEDSVSSVETTKSPLDSEVNIDEVNQPIGDGDDTLSLAAVSNNGSAALVSESTSGV